MQKFQTDYSDHMQKEFPNLMRGVKGSKQSHISIKKWYSLTGEELNIKNKGQILAYAQKAYLLEKRTKALEQTLIKMQENKDTDKLLKKLKGLEKNNEEYKEITEGIIKKYEIKEDDIKVPINYFGRSKLMVEQMLIAYNTAYRLKSVSLRYFNICGADPSGEIGEDHDPETHLIPKAIEASLGRRNVIKIYGTNYPTPDGTCVRDYVDVNDLAKANVLAMQYLEDNGPTTALNLGSGKGKSVTQVLKAVKEVTHSDFKIEKVSKKLGEAATLISSNQRAKSLLGWEPKYTLEQSIVNAYNWHKNHPKGYEK
jgi:UDP-glucose 4-epimerase